jgi:hypothetical protein
MTTRFRPLFTVAIKHGYYAGLCYDFEFITPQTTATDLRGGKLLARVLGGQLHVVYEADSLNAPICSLAGHTLTFGLKLLNPSFANFTAPILSDAAQVPIYTNGDDAAKLDAPLGVVLSSGMHTHTPQTAARPLTLRLSDRLGTVVATQTLEAGATSGSFDLRALPEGPYRIDEDSVGGSVVAKQLYVSADLRDARVWGILAVKIDAGSYGGPAAFTIGFTARQEQLKYFVVARNFPQAEYDQLSVTDHGFGEESRPAVTFDRIAPASFTSDDISPSLLGDGTSRVVMFRSQAPVPRRERGLRKFQLSRNGHILVDSLPQPGPDRAQAHFIIHLAKP